ncbi:MAG: hypothetical protein PWR03_109 [Tenuifilum sp.]|jgi:C_GCAxxG_C_C family probable redox protein|uniref:C-GCAxxG-C-C family protein n=1 Tax=Tenuifilum sp. TaxID=2760880 RepID=UPI0024AC1E36|nr:C-GCAxxG-C-C family protein [Tenuifilum sp.]MDI3525926.1 hypothetical protein [Tenuifilum sp.]
MESKESLAIYNFENGANCAQSILLAFAKEEGLSEELCLQLGSGLGGGIGHKQHVCGAINAGAMIIGLRFGNKNRDDIDGKQTATDLVSEFMDKCSTDLGSANCSKILGIDLNNPEQVEKAKEAGLFALSCGKAIRTVCRLLESDYQKSSL